MTILYLYSKFFKKILRGKSIINSRIDKTSDISSGCSIVDSTIEKYSYCGYDCEITFCEIGKFCSISDHVFIGGAEHPLSWVSTSPVFQNVRHSGPSKRFCKKTLPEYKITSIGHDVWIGHGVSIKQGIKIGHGAVIATGSVVTKDVEPYSIVGGCPAKFIRYRFSKDIIDLLLKSEWWNLPEKELEIIAQDIDNPMKFLSRIESLE